MTDRMRKGLIAAGLVLVLLGVNYTIWAREQLMSNGEILLVELAPVDPRSLMQGDYMALEFAIARQVPRGDGSEPSMGKLVVKRAADGEAVFDRIYTGEALGPEERLLDYRVRDRRVRIVTNAYFFEEGQGQRFEAARYGELRVDASGKALLIGMRDADKKAIRP